MAMTASSLILSIGFFAFSNPAFANEPARFDLNSIKKIASDPGVATVEDFIAKTPAFMKADTNFAMAYHPHGLVPGSPEYPSVLLFGDVRSNVEMVFSSKPTTAETIEDAVEILAFDSSTQTHELARVSFRKGQRPSLEVHPHKCLVCHGENPKPLWRSAFKWEGFFGADAGQFTKTTVTPVTTDMIDEETAWNSFAKNPGPRLSLVELKTKTSTEANLKLTAKLAIEHSYAISQKILRRPHTTSQLADLIASLALCEGDPLFERDLQMRAFGVGSQEWYMNTQLKADAAQGSALHAVANESFEFGEGPMDYLLISQLLASAPEIDSSDFVSHSSLRLQGPIESTFKNEISPLMPAPYLTPVALGGGARPPQSWCADFRAKYRAR